jgi:hypothetical protein
MEWQMEEHSLFGCVLLVFGNEALLIIHAGEVGAHNVNCSLAEWE